MRGLTAGVLLAIAACSSATTSTPSAVDFADAASASGDAADPNAVGRADAGGAYPDAAPCPACARNWSVFPPIVQLNASTDIWALSDVHGDYNALTRLLVAAKLIAAVPSTPTTVTWTGGTATLVIVGDLIDKGPDAVDVVRFAVALRTAAIAVGGNLVVTMGNHEAEFLADPLNSKASGTDGFDPELQAAGFTPASTAAGQNDVGAFIRSLPFAAKVGDWFFVHAGKTDGRTLTTLASDLQTGVDAHGFGAPVLSAPDSLLEARLGSKAPQWWDASGDAATLLTQWTGALGAKHLVMGHQPGTVGFSDNTKRQSDQMVKKYGGLLFLIDTGLSIGADASGGALLRIRNVGGTSETTEEVLPNGSVRQL